MFLGNDPITDESMIASLDALTEGKRDTTVFFRADKTVDYETMMKVMDTLHQAGYLKIGLVGEETVKRSNLSPRIFSGWPCASLFISANRSLVGRLLL